MVGKPETEIRMPANFRVARHTPNDSDSFQSRWKSKAARWHRRKPSNNFACPCSTRAFAASFTLSDHSSFQGVPATGKHYELSAMTVWRFVDGKIAEEWVFSNDLDLYRQLGLFKEPGSTDH